MNDLLTGLVTAVLATNQPQAVSNLIQENVGISVSLTGTNSPAELELERLMMDDDAAHADVDKWIRENDAFAAQGAGVSKADLNKRIRARFDSVRMAYDDFLRRNTNSAHGYLAYGSFLNELGEEYEASQQYEKSRQLDPKNPAAWNNLANYYGEHSPVTNAFVYYAKAIELDSNEPVYYQNLGTTVYLFRKDAREFYGINEQQVFDKALDYYRQAMRLDPDNFPLATDYAQNYYGIKPMRTNDALAAWTNTLKVAHSETEREGVYIHLARLKISFGQFAEAQAHLDAVTNSVYDDMKRRQLRNLAERENEAKTNYASVSTNAVVAPTNAPTSQK